MAELLAEALHEVTAKPVIFAVEVIQFAVLAGLIWFFVPRFIGQKLKERRDTIVTELDGAARAEKEYSDAESKATEIISKAKRDAGEIVGTAKETAEKERAAAFLQAGQEAEEIIIRAKQTIEAEKNKAMSELSEQLVNLVSITTRRFMDEALTESDRQALTQKVILASLEKMESIL